MNAVQTPPKPCLSCGRLIDGASGVDSDKSPKPGDITICFYCGHIMGFNNDLSVRELTKEEAFDVAGDPVIINALKRITRYKKMKGLNYET